MKVETLNPIELCHGSDEDLLGRGCFDFPEALSARDEALVATVEARPLYGLGPL